MSSDPLAEARRRERLSQAAWRQQRAEVARLVAAGEEAAARKLLAQVGVAPPEVPATEVAGTSLPEADPSRREASPEANNGVSAVAAEPVAATPRHASPSRVSDESEAASLFTSDPPKPIRRRKPRRTWTLWLRERPPWVVSLTAHGALLLLCGLLSFATLGEPAFTLTATLGEDGSFDDEAPTPITLDEVLTEAVEPEPLPTLAEPLSLAAEVSLESLVEPVSFEPIADLGDVIAIPTDSLTASVTGADFEGESTEGESTESTSPSAAAPKKKGGRVSFFGAESQATRVVFVVDNSGSMQHGRMETTLYELERAVGRLAKDQEFYVAFFSDQAYPMFFPEGIHEALPATRDNKRRLSAWLHTVEICLGGRLLDAMDLVAGLEPDVVYLLTDGDIRSERVAGRMTDRDAWSFTIHTLGMGARRPQHAQLLGAIAANSGGVYRPVGANPAAVARSRQRPIPYHREPGPVWGSAVTPWR